MPDAPSRVVNDNAAATSNKEEEIKTVTAAEVAAPSTMIGAPKDHLFLPVVPVRDM